MGTEKIMPGSFEKPIIFSGKELAVEMVSALISGFCERLEAGESGGADSGPDRNHLGRAEMGFWKR